MNTVNRPFRKKDAMQLVTGQPVYMDDLVPADCLIVKLLRSPHANAIVKSIDTAVAKKVPGIEAIFTWEDVPQDARRYTQAGQTYPEASPYDRLLIDRHVRFVGDVVAIVAGKDDKCVDKALKLIKVAYEVLEPVLDYHTAKDNPILVHPEDNWESLCPVGADNKRNLCAHDECSDGDIDGVLADCDIVIDHVYHTKACQQAMMETFRTYCSIDLYGRLNVLSSTQIVFHARRIIANALHIPKSMVRVTKPRIGGGFGAKQTAVCEVYPARRDVEDQKALQAHLHPGGEPDRLHPPPRDGNPPPPRCGQGRHHPRPRPLHPLQHRRLRRARPHDGGPFGT